MEKPKDKRRKIKEEKTSKEKIPKEQRRWDSLARLLEPGSTCVCVTEVKSRTIKLEEDVVMEEDGELVESDKERKRKREKGGEEVEKSELFITTNKLKTLDQENVDPFDNNDSGRYIKYLLGYFLKLQCQHQAISSPSHASSSVSPSSLSGLGSSVSPSSPSGLGGSISPSNLISPLAILRFNCMYKILGKVALAYNQAITRVGGQAASDYMVLGDNVAASEKCFGEIVTALLENPYIYLTKKDIGLDHFSADDQFFWNEAHSEESQQRGKPLNLKRLSTLQTRKEHIEKMYRIGWRLARDFQNVETLFKENKFNECSILAAGEEDEHAEMRKIGFLLDTGRLVLQQTEGETKPTIYMGISKLCCPKCIEVIKKVNESASLSEKSEAAISPPKLDITFENKEGEDCSIMQRLSDDEESLIEESVLVEEERLSMQPSLAVRGHHDVTKRGDKWATPSYLDESPYPYLTGNVRLCKFAITSEGVTKQDIHLHLMGEKEGEKKMERVPKREKNKSKKQETKRRTRGKKEDDDEEYIEEKAKPKTSKNKKEEAKFEIARINYDPTPYKVLEKVQEKKVQEKAEARNKGEGIGALFVKQLASMIPTLSSSSEASASGSPALSKRGGTDINPDEERNVSPETVRKEKKALTILGGIAGDDWSEDDSATEAQGSEFEEEPSHSSSSPSPSSLPTSGGSSLK